MRFFVSSTCVFLLLLAPAAAGDEPIDLRFPEPTSIRDVYRAWGEAFGVHVVFDPNLKDRKVSLELRDVRAEPALDTLTRISGQFAVPLDDRTVLIAEDTPAMRRLYERQVIRTFHLENLRLADAMTMVRTLVGAKSVTANEALNSLTVRDGDGKVEVIAELLRTVDKPRGEVAVAVELFYLDAPALARWPENRLSTGELAELRRSARRLTSQELNVLDGDRGLWTLKDQLALAVADEMSFLEVGFELEVEPRVHAGSEEVTLAVKLSATDATRAGLPPMTSNRRIRSGQRLHSGESFLVAGLQKVATGEADSWLASRFGLPGGPGEVVMVLTPRVVRGPGFTEGDLLAFCAGTEVTVELCGGGRPASLAQR